MIRPPRTHSQYLEFFQTRRAPIGPQDSRRRNPLVVQVPPLELVQPHIRFWLGCTIPTTVVRPVRPKICCGRGC